ncbi:MAG TPA: hypothetical protein VE172_06435 [Stackebrandtia sp.]|jgi:hypothetical protein|uniref:hypothetical protein n=1 Tax=Stackebrandtia sp. TaxID=2023065 RepID=UPI002D40A7CF|nr:hypothetical protein [Stackebrandtia sp.]HZE38434.1 hypothetical protein [Stackebrandtia sp.]
MPDDLTAALEAVIAAAREHLAKVRAADGRVDDESVWRAYVSLNNSACVYDEIMRTRYDEVTPFDLEPLEAEEGEAEWAGTEVVDEAVEPDAEPTLVSVRQRRDYVVPSAVALQRAAERARDEVPDPEGDDQPVRGIGDAVLELLHSGDGTLRSLEIPELTPMDGIVVINEVGSGLDVTATSEGGEDVAFAVDAGDPVIGRLDERSFQDDHRKGGDDDREEG